MIEAVDGPLRLRTRVCVIGSGAGGAVAAATCAAAGLDVVILEEGDLVPTEDFRGEPLEAFRRLYRGRGLTATMGNVTIPLPMGRTVGGTTVVNSGTCFRAPEYVLQEWREVHGVADCSEGELAPLYAEVEEALSVTRVPEALLGKNSELFRRGAERLGLAGGPIPRNARGCKATGVCVFGCPRGAKQDMKVSYLPRAHAAGARLYPRCRVERLHLEGGRVARVAGTVMDREDRPTGATLEVRCDAVVLAAGAIYSPLLLAASGLARGTPETGGNLRIHPSVRVVALFDEAVDGHRGVPQGYHVHEYERQGIFIQGMFVPPGVESPSVPGIGRELQERMDRYRHLGSFGALISDKGSGRVHALPGGLPLIRYDLSERDRATMLEGILRVAEVFFAAGAREVYPPVNGFRVLRSMDDARAMVAAAPPADHLEPMAFHPMGTCRMGRGPRDSVVDGYGRHHLVEGLYLADASLFPSSTHTNPQMTIMAYALRVGRRVVEDLG